MKARSTPWATRCGMSTNSPSIRHAAGCADGAWPCARKPPAVGAWQACTIPKCSSSRARLPEQAAKASREEAWLSRLRGLSCAFLTRCAVRLPTCERGYKAQVWCIVLLSQDLRAGQARCEACGDAAQQGRSMKQEPAESALVETKPGFVGILAFFKGGRMSTRT